MHLQRFCKSETQASYKQTRYPSSRAVWAKIIQRFYNTKECRKSKTSIYRISTNRQGSVQILAAVLLVVTFGCSWGIWQVMHILTKRTEIQLSLDRCTAGAASSAAQIIGLIHSSNLRKKAYLSTSPSAIVLPPITSAIKTALKAETLFQNILKKRWKWLALSWQTQTLSECNKYRPMATSTFPAYPFSPDPPTPFGPGPSLYKGIYPDIFFARYANLESKTQILNSNKSSTRPKIAWIK